MDRFEMDDILRYLCDKEFPDYIENDTKNKKKTFRRKCQNFSHQNGVLYYNHLRNGLLRVVSKEEKIDIIQKVHEQPTGHLGETRTWRNLSLKYYWLGIVKDVASFIQQCQICRTNHAYRKSNYENFALYSANIEIDLDNQGEVPSSQPPKITQLFPNKLDQEIQKWAQQCTSSALDDDEDDLQDTASALDDAELWAEQQRVAISALGEEIQNWSLQQQNSASLLETDIEQLSTAQQQSTSSLEKDLERWASRHSTPTRIGGGLHHWTTNQLTNQLRDVASSLDRDLEKWENLHYSNASNVDKLTNPRQPTAVSLDKDLEKWANLQQTNFSSVDKNLEKWKRRRDRPVLSLTPEKWPSPHNVMSMSLDRDLEKWEHQQRENAASLERDLEKWVGECQQSALTRESDLEKWVTLHRKKTLFLEKEIDDWVDKRRHSMTLLENEIDQWHRRHSSVSLLEREAKKNPGNQFRAYPERPGGALPRRDWKRVMRRRTFKETSV